MTTWRALLREADDTLASTFEARVALEEVSARTFSCLLGHLDDQAETEKEARLHDLVERRRRGEPLQHLVSRWAFRTLEIECDSRALIPRPETEFVVECGLFELDRIDHADAIGPFPGRIVSHLVIDLGTGTGVIGCAIASERKSAVIVAIDSSLDALDLARSNRALLPKQVASRVHLLASDWMSALELCGVDRASLVIANPPYLSEQEWTELDPVVKAFDPRAALVAGPSGLEAVAAILEQIGTLFRRPCSLVCEIAPHQADLAIAMARAHGASSAKVATDLSGRERALVARYM